MLDRLYVFDGFAGWEPEVSLRLDCIIICSRKYSDPIFEISAWMSHLSCLQQSIKILNKKELPTQSRIKVRVVCARAYHALFMYNMLIRPTDEELATFGKPDFTIFNAGAFPVNRYTSYMSSSTSVDVNMRCAF